MSGIQIETSGRQALDKATRLLAGIDGGIGRAVRSAMPRTVSHLRTSSAKAIREKYAISAANLKAAETVHAKYTYQDGVQALVTFSGHKIPLYRYDGAAPAQPAYDAGAWVSAIVAGKWRKVHPSLTASGHQLKSTSPRQLQDAFVARMKSGHVGIFQRTGGSTANGSDTIEELMGSSVPQMLGDSQVAEALTQQAMEHLEQRLEQEVLRILNGWGM